MPDPKTPDPTLSDSPTADASGPDASTAASADADSATVRLERPAPEQTRSEPSAAEKSAAPATAAPATETAETAPGNPAPDNSTPTTVIPHATRAAPVRVGPGRPAPTRVQPPAAGAQEVPAAPAANVPAAAPRPARIPATEPAPTGRRRWPLLVAVVAVVALAVGAGAYLLSGRSADNTQSQVEDAIHTFTGAIAAGDLTTLRASTCGELGGYYQRIHDAQFAQVYKASTDQGSIPVIDSVDAVSVTDGTAIAQVTVHTAAAPNDRSARSFTLQQDGEVWKVC
ncbi:Rv0361 family membrane protein [Rhodococcus tukisamuensis]|uniref:Rv0361 family membrane protein n=1 Tax=Rhodococcus tukisamuensis TaxID=168276 RepID=UPI001113F104|nr:hypothetical protein [Rhodococcus tukisamuensis]